MSVDLDSRALFEESRQRICYYEPGTSICPDAGYLVHRHLGSSVTVRVCAAHLALAVRDTVATGQLVVEVSAR